MSPSQRTPASPRVCESKSTSASESPRPALILPLRFAAVPCTSNGSSGPFSLFQLVQGIFCTTNVLLLKLRITTIGLCDDYCFDPDCLKPSSSAWRSDDGIKGILKDGREGRRARTLGVISDLVIPSIGDIDSNAGEKGNSPSQCDVMSTDRGPFC